ncbi:hypothetical protein JMUB6875_28690 [Nocardia sp. JMUB6875]|uniref:hypothetical protein n=1 Tax=Nocardia sp. JMUB6875 TaxID=3158170 RepID=UPI0032E714B9
MKPFRLLVVVTAALAVMVFGGASAWADPPDPGAPSGPGDALVFPLMFICVNFFGTGSDSPNPQCIATFEPMRWWLRQHGS